MPSYITHTGAFLPGAPVANDRITDYLGLLDGEEAVRQQVLGLNGIASRHYAQDLNQQPTHDLYDLATQGAIDCLKSRDSPASFSFLSAGTTYAPLSGPGTASLLHRRLSDAGHVSGPVEISSHSGICSSAAAGLVAAVRAVESGAHQQALSVGAEHASEVLKSSAIRPIDDRTEHTDIKRSQWFMAVFLRSMLSDGAGAALVESEPAAKGISLRVDWTHSQSFASETPLCMKLTNSNALLTQDTRILAKHLFPCTRRFVESAFSTYDETLGNYRCVLPHISSFFFRRKMEGLLKDLTPAGQEPPPYWVNLATAGNTGAASAFVLLDEFRRTQPLEPGDRILLFVPESGQFNFVLLSLTAVAP